MTLQMSDLSHERASGRMTLVNIDLDISNEIVVDGCNMRIHAYLPVLSLRPLMSPALSNDSVG